MTLDTAAFKKSKSRVAAGRLRRAGQQQNQNANPKLHSVHGGITRDLRQLYLVLQEGGVS